MISKVTYDNYLGTNARFELKQLQKHRKGCDSGYGTHFARIARQFPHIDLAIMENGQYSKNWRHIHLMPEGLINAIKELQPKTVLTGHHGKYALSNHAWDEPLHHAAAIVLDAVHVVMPIIGEVVHFSNKP